MSSQSFKYFKVSLNLFKALTRAAIQHDTWPLYCNYPILDKFLIYSCIRSTLPRERF